MNQEVSQSSQMILNKQSINFLRETAKWCNFLSILGFVGIGLLVLIAIFAGAIFSALPNADDIPFGGGVFLTVFYLIIAVIYFFPTYYMFKFSVDTKNALSKKDEDLLTEGLEMLKAHYKYMGIFYIIIISMYIFMFLGAILFGAFAAL